MGPLPLVFPNLPKTLRPHAMGEEIQTGWEKLLNSQVKSHWHSYYPLLWGEVKSIRSAVTIFYHKQALLNSWRWLQLIGGQPCAIYASIHFPGKELMTSIRTVLRLVSLGYTCSSWNVGEGKNSHLVLSWDWRTSQDDPGNAHTVSYAHSSLSLFNHISSWVANNIYY